MLFSFAKTEECSKRGNLSFFFFFACNRNIFQKKYTSSESEGVESVFPHRTLCAVSDTSGTTEVKGWVSGLAFILLLVKQFSEKEFC